MGDVAQHAFGRKGPHRNIIRDSWHQIFLVCEVLIRRATWRMVCTVSSGRTPVLSGARFSRRLAWRLRQSEYADAMVSALWVVNPSRQNQLCIGGMGLYG